VVCKLKKNEEGVIVIFGLYLTTLDPLEMKSGGGPGAFSTCKRKRQEERELAK